MRGAAEMKVLGIAGSPRRGGNMETAPMKALVDRADCSQVEMVRARRISDVGDVRKRPELLARAFRTGRRKGNGRSSTAVSPGVERGALGAGICGPRG